MQIRKEASLADRSMTIVVLNLLAKPIFFVTLNMYTSRTISRKLASKTQLHVLDAKEVVGGEYSVAVEEAKRCVSPAKTYKSIPHV